ncbi:MAG: hypothetical protein KA154_00920 [Gemmatimonadaceae bacterium]|jgi:hypothetical protein|nr:hypothetical protein [Gemmatimonadaceae bacterium]MCC6433197.1 hypothetical protein [Gemmatimonadaceae bacterium]
MHVSFALFADAANLSQEGKLNILGVFDAVHVGQFPALHPRATFVLRLKGASSDVGTHVMTLQWVNPRGTVLWTSDAELAIQSPPNTAAEMDMPVIVQIDLPLDVIGDYAMVVDLDGERHGEAILHVRAGAPMAMPAPGSMMLS